MFPPRGCGSPVVKVSNHGRHVMSSIPVPLKTRRVGQRCTLNLSRAETSSRWCGVVDKVLGRNRSSAYPKAMQEAYYIGGNDAGNESPKEKEKSIVRAKLIGAKFLGSLCSYIMKPNPDIFYPPGTETHIESFVKLIIFHLNFKSAMQRFAVALVLNEWAKYGQKTYIVLSAKRNRRTTAQQVANQFLAASGKQISRKTVARRLRGGGLYARRPVVCIPLTRQRRTARLQWCREHHNWTEQDWACVLFSDESRFSLSSDCRRQLIWRESGTAYRPENIQKKDRYPTCSIMVWAGIMINGRMHLHVVVNGTMTGQRYIDEVLLPHDRLFRGSVGDKFVFMDDNATCHRTLAVQDCLDSEGIQRLVWPARSPDLNPIENVWDALGRQVAGRNYPPTTKNTLIRALTEEWDKLPQQLLDNVVQSMDMCPLAVKEKCLECLNETVYYDEIAVAFTRLQQECKDFIALSKHYSVTLDLSFQTGPVFTFEQIIQLTTVAAAAFSSTKLKPKVLETLEERRKSLLRSTNLTSSDQAALTVMVQSSIAGALVSLKHLPEKLNPIIRPLMDSIKREENELLQKASAHHLVNLMELCLTRTSCPNPKILKNLTNFLCYDIVCQNFGSDTNSSAQNVNSSEKLKLNTSLSLNENSIITLINMQKWSSGSVLRIHTTGTGSIPRLAGQPFIPTAVDEWMSTNLA
ncbi:TATA-binding protein-associated factor 172 [Trichonephila clavipes]|nr:TATA-binding protein-associated factor 172 [Trichonephila clavipes]